MNIDFNNIDVEDNPVAGRYQAYFGQYLAIAAYRLNGNTITFTHTQVPKELEGRGIAGKLAHAALEDARARQLTVVPLCPFIASYIRRHQEYVTLVDPAYRERVTKIQSDG
jgi:predicted GNAT family acetyltransferase